MLNETGRYASWGGYSVQYDEKAKTFSLRCNGKTNAVKNLKIETITIGEKTIVGLETFKKRKYTKIKKRSPRTNCKNVRN